ncbi:MAG: 30S ribosome-binding factor RbfA [Candidatus Eisenbacteria bacterium]|nr:30S ribosome-binding factor RbfA [Candidatus Eisenbacteria bacterium]
MKYKRSERVSALVLHELADIIERGLRDPDIGFVTLTRVVVSDDLRNAKVFVVTRGEDDVREKTLRGLERAVPHFRRELGSRLELRYVPQLRFYPDPSFDHAESIQRLLERIHREEEEA